MAAQASESTTSNLPAERPGTESGAGGTAMQIAQAFDGNFVRQLVIGILVAAGAAAAVVIFLWSQGADYRTVYGDLAERDAAQATQLLEEAGIDYRLDPGSGAIQVAQGSVHEARLQLAAEGLPRGAGVGFEMLEGESGFGVSQFMEQKRYHSALQTELARTINSVNAVESSRVHLAIPEDSVFVRNRRQPSASVMVNLYRGRTLSDSQVSAIVHMVSSSITDMPAERVTVVDQRGRLLSDSGDGIDGGGASEQFDFTQRLEQAYASRIEDILAPILGPGRVRAQVTADLDFTRFEQTEETYDPDTTAVRSEQESETPQAGSAGGGIPGALTNQPPGLVNEEDLAQNQQAPADDQGQAGAAGEEALAEEAQQAGIPTPVARRVIRNYEVDRTVAHTVQSLGQIQRLSVAVVVDDQEATNEEGEVVSEPLTEEELARVESLVREAVGFAEGRGDSVSVVNDGFIEQEAEEPEEPAFWEQPWFMELLRQLLGVVVVLAVIFGLVRPGMRSLAAARRTPDRTAPASRQPAGESPELAAGDESGREPGERLQLSKQQDYDDKVAAAKGMVTEDSKRVAQVVRNWVKE